MGREKRQSCPCLGDALAGVARAMLGPRSQGTLMGLPKAFQGDSRGSQGPQGARMLCQHPWAATPGKGERVDIPPSQPLRPSPCPCNFDPCCLFCPFVLCVLGVVVGSRGVYGRSGFASFFKSSAPSATRPETQPLLPASRRPSPPGRDTYGTSSLSSSSNSGSCKGSDSSPTPR